MNSFGLFFVLLVCVSLAKTESFCFSNNKGPHNVARHSLPSLTRHASRALVNSAYSASPSPSLHNNLVFKRNTFFTTGKVFKGTALSSQAGTEGPDLDPDTKDMLDMLVGGNKIVLFMKGNKLFPQCGFSNTAVRILDAIGTDFETVDVLENDRIRNGVKIFSAWPTIPQLYVDGEFVGGTDIMIEMYETGELAEMIELANAN